MTMTPMPGRPSGESGQRAESARGRTILIDLVLGGVLAGVLILCELEHRATGVVDLTPWLPSLARSWPAVLPCLLGALAFPWQLATREGQLQSRLLAEFLGLASIGVLTMGLLAVTAPFVHGSGPGAPGVFVAPAILLSISLSYVSADARRPVVGDVERAHRLVQRCEAYGLLNRRAGRHAGAGHRWAAWSGVRPVISMLCGGALLAAGLSAGAAVIVLGGHVSHHLGSIGQVVALAALLGLITSAVHLGVLSVALRALANDRPVLALITVLMLLTYDAFVTSDSISGSGIVIWRVALGLICPLIAAAYAAGMLVQLRSPETGSVWRWDSGVATIAGVGLARDVAQLQGGIMHDQRLVGRRALRPRAGGQR